ncbi:hypothetical protein D0Z00_002326 [Geotrichum galactomycetum]|uniref:Uncharacterized protein n=1 Tax=Geotrichum galactomycetum TaxID=27317 RepID=A0ACB6V4D3_9ASCO|nr:hypothetical protein D0Z00_002326 [Geotrichum candidum]
MADNDSTNPKQTWKFSQCFGDKGDIENITEADVISTVEFDHTGNYLATGDRGGRVVLFERNESKKGCEYMFHTEFQSHDAEFDYLKSLEIEEKINKIKWCKRQNQAHFLLSTNDKTIKLWKVYEKSIKVVAENNLSDSQGRPPSLLNINSLALPRMTLHDTIIAATPRRIYANAHTYHINSISVNSDGETYISADDLRINLWNLGIADQSFNIVDIKPANMEELTEVITAAEFHPQSCNLFMYSSSKGTIKLADMRERALCDTHSKLFEEWMDPAQHSFFTEITSSISDVRFSFDGRYIVSRDYMTVKIWDVNMEREPVKTISIHEHIRDKLCDTYENDAIFDKFEVVFSGDGKSVMTGSYNNNFMIYPNSVDPKAEETEIVLQADKSAFKAKKVGMPMSIGSGNGLMNNGRNRSPGRAGINMMRRDAEYETIDFKKSILHLSWHPHENSIAIAATNNLFVFSTL